MSTDNDQQITFKMEIECEFESDEFFGYSCEVTKASITKPNVDIACFKGHHHPGRSNNDVTRVDFDNVVVEYFPRNLQKIFPNLSSLTIRNCGLKEISHEDLIGLDKLVYLNLGENQLKSLPDDLFTNMPNLKEVNLETNKIEFVTSKLIEPIVANQINFFFLRFNTSIDDFYHPGWNYGCKTIQELMVMIDEKCKPPDTPTISKTPQVISNCCIKTEREIFKSFNKFRLMGCYTDFVIVVGSKEFPVNKIILASQSSVLAERFEVKVEGRFASKLEISDSSEEAVEAFLDYLYERKQPDAQNADEIFKLAAKYEVEKLKTICEEIILEYLDESNAFEIFKLACGPQKSENLKVAAFNTLQEKFGDELDDDLMKHPDQLQKIVEAKKLLDDLMTKSKAMK